MRFQEVNYILEAENQDIAVYSLCAVNAIDKNMDYNVVIMIPKQNIADIKGVLNHLRWETEKLINLHETKYGKLLRTLKIKDTSKFVKAFLGRDNKQMYDNKELLLLRKQLRKVKEIPSYVVETNDHCMKISRPDFLIVETDAVTIKVPSKYVYNNSSDDPNWDYDYLLYPNQNMDLHAFRVNQELIDTLNRNLLEMGVEDFLNIKIPNNINLLDGYTPNRYEILRRKMRDISLKTKAIINVIREDELNNSTLSEYYGVYQESRMARENKSPYTEIRYNSTYSKEVTFPSVFRDILKKQPSQYCEIDEDALEDFASTLDESTEEGLLKDDLQVIVDYVRMKKNKVSGQFIMIDYEEAERQRELVREELFLANLSMVGNLEDLFQYLGNVYCNANLSLFDFGYTLGELSKNIKLSFKFNEVSVSDLNTTNLGLTDYIVPDDDTINLLWENTDLSQMDTGE